MHGGEYVCWHAYLSLCVCVCECVNECVCVLSFVCICNNASILHGLYVRACIHMCVFVLVCRVSLWACVLEHVCLCVRE